jgi:hypothetical protein
MKGLKMVDKFMANRLASAVYALVENSYAYDLSIADGEPLSYAEACELMGLDDFETEAVLKLIDEDLAIV